MTELKIFKDESEHFEGVLKCKKNYRAGAGACVFIAGESYPWRFTSEDETTMTGCKFMMRDEFGPHYINLQYFCEYFEDVCTSYLVEGCLSIGPRIVLVDGNDKISVADEDPRTTAIKELTDAIDGLFRGEEIDINGHLSYILRVEDVNAAIRLAKKYQQLIEGKS